MALKFRYAALLACAAAAFCVPSLRAAEIAPESSKMPCIYCPGEYRGHLQGLATDGRAIYWVFSRDIVKTGFDGGLLAHRVVPHHSGDPCWKDGKLFVPVCRSGFNREPKPGAESNNHIFVYDAELDLLEKHHIPEVKYGAGCVAERGGHFFVAGGRPDGMKGNTVYEYSPDFKLLRRHELDFDSIKGIQTINFASGKWYFGCYGTRGETVEADGDFRVARRVLPGSAVGMIPLPDGKLLVGKVASDYKRGGALILKLDGFAPAKARKEK